MAQRKTRVITSRQTPSRRERMAFPILLVLVMGVVVFGMFFYTGLLVAGSVIFVGNKANLTVVSTLDDMNRYACRRYS